MSISIRAECEAIQEEGFSCDSPFVDALKPLVAAVPEVGETVVGIFEVTCAVSDIVNG